MTTYMIGFVIILNIIWLKAFSCNIWLADIEPLIIWIYT
jgi:hypothetical protein